MPANSLAAALRGDPAAATTALAALPTATSEAGRERLLAVVRAAVRAGAHLPADVVDAVLEVAVDQAGTDECRR